MSVKRNEDTLRASYATDDRVISVYIGSWVAGLLARIRNNRLACSLRRFRFRSFVPAERVTSAWKGASPLYITRRV